MSDDRQDIDEAELHAYVDDLLNEDRRMAVESALVGDSVAAEMVRAYREQNRRLTTLFGDIAEESIPERLSVDRIVRRGVWSRRVRSMAAAALWLAIGLGSGWGANELLRQSSTSAFEIAGQAVNAHRVYSVEVRHPVEVAAAEEEHLVRWLSKRLDYQINMPHLTSFGYQLVGGRLLPSRQGVAAQFMYENALGTRLTLYATKTLKNKTTAFRFTSAGEISAFYWLDGPVAYALIGEVERSTLLQITNVAYEALNRP